MADEQGEATGIDLSGDNLKSLVEDIGPHLDTLDSVEASRKKLNAKAQEARESIRALGLDMKAIEKARQFKKIEDKETRDTFDISYEIGRRALGVPVQGTLFEE